MYIGEILIEKHNVNSKDIEKALQFQRRYGGLIGNVLINMGIVSEEIMVVALSDQLGLKTFSDIDLALVDYKKIIENDSLNLDFLISRRFIPLYISDDTVSFAAVNPLELDVVQYLQGVTPVLQVFIVSESQFRGLEDEFSLVKNSNSIGDFDFDEILDSEIDRLRELATEAPVVNLVNSLISRAVGQKASDLHFEPFKNMYRVRFRIDGQLHDIDFLHLNMQLPVSSRIKILAGLDIAERRRPQDGQISMKIASKEIDIRVSTLPLAEGESIVLRFLVKDSIGYDLSHLGLEDDYIELLKEDIAKTSGVIMMTGPTGSGKTTTLYSCLNRINSEDKKIITIEDPVEYQLNGINQININPEIGYDFLAALRSILRQDPDILMIGEIRDGETARVAMQSSLTGHLVFTTVHTNDAATAYTRLLNLGLPEYLINSSLVAVIAQRLVRKLCPDCAVESKNQSAIIKTYDLATIALKANIDEIKIMEPAGCNKCNNTGFSGRVGIMEYLRCSDELKAIPKDSDFLIKTAAYMKDNDIRDLKEDGFLKVIKGLTCIDEIMRVCG